MKTSCVSRQVVLAAFLLAACNGKLSASTDGAAAQRSDPPLTVDAATMSAALRCPAQFTSPHNPVLLVHGTGVNADINWDSGLVPVLQQHGYDACTIDLPKNSWGDIQLATQYVVHAVDTITQRSGKQVTLTGHSQGVMQIHWAIKWWPRVDQAVDEVIGLAGIYHGVELVQNNICSFRLCPPAAWQMDRSSQFVAAMLRDDETPGRADYSSLFSMDDANAVYPIPVLAGARNIAVQDICPDRKVAHARMAFDAVALALVLDALEHEGPADASRINPEVCQQDFAPGINAADAQYKEGLSSFVFVGTLPMAGLVGKEPKLQGYVSNGP